MDESKRLIRLAVSICSEHFPSKKKMGNAAKAAGFQAEGTSGKARVYSGNGKRMLFGVTKSACLFSVEKISEAQAISLAKTIVLKPIRKVSIPKKKDKGLLADWRGTLNGVKVQLGVTKPTTIGWMKTPLIVIAKTK